MIEIKDHSLILGIFEDKFLSKYVEGRDKISVFANNMSLRQILNTVWFTSVFLRCKVKNKPTLIVRILREQL